MVEISQTGDQMLTVLETVAEKGPMSAAEVARLCELNRTVVHRLLVTLSQRGYVRRSEEGYVLGPALFTLVRQPVRDIRDIAKPIMEKLAEETGETVVLHGIDNTEAVVLEQAVGQAHLVRVEHKPRTRHPLTKGASGWSLLAFQPEKTIARVLKKTGETEDAVARLQKIKEDGYAVSHDELQMGVHGVATPLLTRDGRCLASLAILVPSTRATGLSSLAPSLIAAAAQIGEELD